MQRTPSKTGDKINEFIDRLNAEWNLRIERLHGQEATEAGEGAEIARKCAARIRWLCWKDLNMNAIFDDFEEKAKQKNSEWRYKPSQEAGTLPCFPKTKSMLWRDATQRNRVSPKGRLVLLRILSELLDEEYKLFSESDDYSRTSFTTDPHTSRNTSFASTRSMSKQSFVTASDGRAVSLNDATRSGGREARRDSANAATSNKKRKAVLPAQTNPESSKKQQTLSQVFRRNSTRSSDLQTEPSRFHTPSQHIQQAFQAETSRTIDVALPQQTSFNTNMSDEVDSVFSGNEQYMPSSNDTSILSFEDDNRDSQFSGATQLEHALQHDISFNKSLEQADNRSSSLDNLLDTLPETGPFRRPKQQLPRNLPFWFNYELHRLKEHLGVSTVVIWKNITKICKREHPTLEQYWDAVKMMYKDPESGIDSANQKLPIKSDMPDWLEASKNYYDRSSGKSMSLTAKLNFADDSRSHLFDLEINPMKQDQSCRFHRRFGADRFIVLDLPYFDRRSLPAHLRNSSRADQIHDIVFKWLTMNDLYICGRTWRAFFVEPIKSRSKKKRKEENNRQRMHLFAVQGSDFKTTGARSQSDYHRPIPLMEFVQWHLPLKYNLESTDMKLFSRMQLGLSKTAATIVLEPHEFIHIKDIPARYPDGRATRDGTIMTDGCARISKDLANDIWKEHGKPGEPVPSAFQARIGGAKGLWQVDYSGAYQNISERSYWIEVSDSQLKIKPHPKDRIDADEHQRTFEIVKYSSRCYPGYLNIQLINILDNRNVPKSTFQEAISADLKEYLTTLEQAMADPLALRVWRQAYHPLSEGRDNLAFCGSMPNMKEDELDLLLESGFEPLECAYLTTCLKHLIKQELDTYVDKLRIQLPYSTTTFCVPDMQGILKPGEIQLNFSTHQMHPVTGLTEGCLRDLDKVLVSRNPAHLASDIQAVKPVYYEELRHSKDVILFSTQGQHPLADLLSGGDYDGDTVTVIWDPSFTEKFQNVGRPRLASKAECGVRSKSKRVREVFNVAAPSDDQLERFMLSCCSLNGVRNKLGEVTVEHETLLYNNPRSLTDIGPVTLASLAGYLVDAPKQGDSLSYKDWMSLRQRIRGKGVYPTPAYKENSTTRPKKILGGDCLNIIDHLKFDVAARIRDSVLTKFHDQWGSKAIALDGDVKDLFNRERIRARNMSSVERQSLTAVLDDLYYRIGEINHEWQKLCGREDEEIFRRELEGSSAIRSDFAKKVEGLTAKVEAIEPLCLDCDVRREFERDGGGKGSRWSLLRASCMHYRFPGSTMSWKLVGDEMCRLKAKKQGRTWEMTLRMRAYMKADIKKGRRLGGEDYDDGNDDVFFDAEE